MRKLKTDDDYDAEIPLMKKFSIIYALGDGPVS